MQDLPPVSTTSSDASDAADISNSSDERHDLLPQSEVTHNIAKLRLGIGFAQGVLLYFLYSSGKSNAWSVDFPLLFASLLVLAVTLPTIAMHVLGHLPLRQIGRGLLIYAGILTLLSCYEIWRSSGLNNQWGSYGYGLQTSYPSIQFNFCLFVALFIAQSLWTAGAIEQRRIASYQSYFETAWKLLVQLKFSALFLGVLWLILALGAQLFKMIGLNFYRNS